MRKRGPSYLEPIGALLGRQSGLRTPAGIEASPVASRDWEAAVGTRIAARTRPLKLERGVLLILAASSTWAQELTLLADAILEQLRARRIPAKSLRFRVGPVEAPDRPPQRADVRKAPPPVPLPPELQSELARVENEELREAIARAASRNLGWQRLNQSQRPSDARRSTQVQAAAERREARPSQRSESDVDVAPKSPIAKPTDHATRPQRKR